ncbi:MAG: hypothetical protein KGZ85_03130 [Ignavibacterium sp.]|nr:hypothetical protein [Ignavibacterium sp.]
MGKNKSLSVKAVFAIPKDPDYADEYLDMILEDSIRKFYGMSTHIPSLPSEFALKLVLYDEVSKTADAAKAVWMTAKKDSAYLAELGKEVDFYNLEVVEIFSTGEFEEEINIMNGQEIRTGKIIINNNQN